MRFGFDWRKYCEDKHKAWKSDTQDAYYLVTCQSLSSRPWWEVSERKAKDMNEQRHWAHDEGHFWIVGTELRQSNLFFFFLLVLHWLQLERDQCRQQEWAGMKTKIIKGRPQPVCVQEVEQVQEVLKRAQHKRSRCYCAESLINLEPWQFMLST